MIVTLLSDVGVEAEEGVGRFRQVLRAHQAALLQCAAAACAHTAQERLRHRAAATSTTTETRAVLHTASGEKHMQSFTPHRSDRKLKVAAWYLALLSTRMYC